MSDICSRPGCDNEKNTGAMYCSVSCANKENGRKRRERAAAERELSLTNVPEEVEVLRKGIIPRSLENVMVQNFGHSAAYAILTEIEEMFVEDANNGVSLDYWPEHLRKMDPTGYARPSYGVEIGPPSTSPPDSSRIEPWSVLNMRYGMNFLSDMRTDKDVSYTDIDRMLKLGPCFMASRIKKGPIMSALTGKRRWTLRSSDNKLLKVAEADLERVFMRHINDMMTALDYGTAFGSTIWTRKTAEQVGAATGVGRQSEWVVIDKIQWAHPSSVNEILRNASDNSFAGYVHRRRRMEPRDVTIDPHQALVLTYGGQFGNMWGTSIFEPVYDFALWYELTMRAFLRFNQRMATPVAVVKGPQSGTSKRPDGTRINNPLYGLLLASAASNSAALWIPSERDLQSGEPLWEIGYMDKQEKGEMFIPALQYLGTQIMRGVLVGDRSFTQDGETGSYGAGEVHNKLTQIDNDLIFKTLLWQLNDYLVMRYGMWNVDFNSPPMLKLHAEVIDPDEQEVLMKLFATAGNVKLFDGSPLDIVDWEEAFRSINVPVLEDEEFEALYKESMDRKLDNQKLFQQAQEAAIEGGDPFGGNPNRKSKPPQENKDGEDASDEEKQTRLSIIEGIASGGLAPVMLSYDDVQTILGRRESYELGDISGIDGRGPADEEFERKHPRGPDGRFAKKREEEYREGEGGEEGEGEWEGADPDRGIKGVITLDGVEYTVIGQDVTREEIELIHQTNMEMMETASTIGYDLEPAPVIVTSKTDAEAISKYSGNSVEDVQRWMDRTDGFSAHFDEQGRVLVDNGLSERPDLLEPILFHETLHTQPRDGNPNRGQVSGYTEEVFTTLATMEYAELKGNSRYIVGYPTQVSQMVEAARVLGWHKQRLYDYARECHQVDGGGYREMLTSVLEKAGVSESVGYSDALLDFAPTWEDDIRELDSVYDFGFGDIVKEFWK